MPEELIYTSVARGLKSGSSGFCTTATTPDMREALITRLEQLSYYKHLSTSGGTDQVICCYRHLKIRDEHYRVLTRLTDAGADFSGRTNFVAHHLVLTGAEVGQLALGARRAGMPIPSPAEVFLYWPDWRDRWDEEAGLLPPRDLDSIISCQRLMLPAETWDGVVGDAAAGWGMFERVRKNDPISSGDMGVRTVLCLMAESLQMLEEREPAKWWNGSTWNYTFTTQTQAEDLPVDFDWNFVADGSDSGIKALNQIKQRLKTLNSSEFGNPESEIEFARMGFDSVKAVFRSPPNNGKTGGKIVLGVKTSGRPTPRSIKWQTENGQLIGDGPSIQHELVEGVNRVNCTVGNFRDEQTISLSVIGKSPLSFRRKRVKARAGCKVDWTASERVQFAQKIGELGEKNPKLHRDYFETTSASDIDVTAPLSRQQLVELVLRGSGVRKAASFAVQCLTFGLIRPKKRKQLTKGGLKSIFKVLSFAEDTKKLELVRGVLADYDDIVAGKDSDGKAGNFSTLTLLIGTFLLVAGGVGLVVRYLGPGSTKAPAQTESMMSINSGPLPMIGGPGVDSNAVPVAIAVEQKSANVPVEDRMLVEAPEISDWSMSLAADKPDKHADYFVLRSFELEENRPLPTQFAGLRRIAQSHSLKENGWTVTPTNETLRIAHRDGVQRYPPEVLITHQGEEANYLVIGRVDGVDLDFRYRTPDAEPGNEDTRLWMKLLRSLPSHQQTGNLNEDLARGVPPESITKIDEINKKLGVMMRGERSGVDSALSFHRRKLRLFEQVEQIWSALDELEPNDKALLDDLGANSFWVKHGKVRFRNTRQVRQIVKDMYVLVRYHERRRSGKPEIVDYREHTESDMGKWLNSGDNLWDPESLASRVLLEWRDIERTGPYKSNPKLIDFIREWRQLPEEEERAPSPMLSEFRIRMQGLSQKNGAALIRTRSFELSVPAVGSFNIVLREN